MAEDMRALIAHLVSSQQDQQLRHEQVMAEQQQQTAIMRAELQGLIRARESQETDRSMSRINPARFIVKQTPNDDVETFLLTFERTAQREDWPEEHWADLIAPFLTGVAQTTYQDLSDGRAVEYEALRVEILKRLGYTMVTRAQRFHDWRYDSRAAPRAQMHELTRLANSWLASEPSTLSPIERVVMDHYIHALPVEARKLACQNSPQDAVQLVGIMEGYQAAQRVVPARSTPQNDWRSRPRPPAAEDRPRTRAEWGEPRRCFRCGKLGHVAWDCLADATMETAASGNAAGPRGDCGWGSTVGRQGDRPPPTTPVKANGQDTTALLDSGSAVTLVRPEFAPGPRLKGTVGVTCIHGDTREYPTAQVHLQTTKGQSRSAVGVVAELPVPVLIGRDIPMFPELWRAAACGGRTSDEAGEKKRRPAGKPICGYQEIDEKATTEPMEEGAASAAEQAAGRAEDRGTARESPSRSDENDERGWAELFPMNVDEPLLPGPLAGRFGTAQMEDLNLAQALRSIAMVEGRQIDGVSHLTHPYFAIKNKLLYQVVWVNGEQRELLLVPQPFVNTVLHLAHTHLLGAHLGVEKTLDRIRSRFTWPGVKRAVEDHCRSCPDCQMVAPRPRQKAPLIPLPIIDVPFRRIAMDLVGPLPQSRRGHKYILVIVDYATRYPEAIPLRTMATKGIARELMMLFSRVGIPGEILTDQGTPFMSRIMRDLCTLLGVKQLRTSVYHPQTDGLVERFNQTLKNMLKKEWGQVGGIGINCSRT